MSTSAKWFLAIFGVLLVLGLGVTFFFYALMSATGEKTETVTTGSGSKIAVVELNGVISSSDEIVRQIKKYRKDISIKAILLHVNSPGGGVVASQEMFEEVKRTRDGGKPVVVSMGALAASGGYYVSVGATKIVANRGTLTGSIGVISEFLQMHEALAKLGIELKTIKAGKLKDAGSPGRKMSEEDQKYFQEISDGIHRQFIGAVETERNIPHEKMLEIADGRVFTGEQAVGLGLVDTLGTFEDAVRITAGLVGISGEPSLVKERRRAMWYESLFGGTEEALKELKQEIIDRPVMSYRYTGPY